jgi:DNA-directed RNA polymerase subunit RPC12/RpoP
MILNWNFNPKPKTCVSCGEERFFTYGANFSECEECYFKRFPKEDVEKFYRRFFE